MFGFGGSSQETLVRSLKREGIIKNQRVEQSMLFVDRRHFCSHTPFPYADQPQGIGHGATISAPHMHAYALETLKDHLFEGAHALDVGSGSGYLVACIAQMVGETGLVVGIDHIPELVELSVANLKSDPKLAALLQGSSASARSSASTAADATQTQNRSPSWSASGPHPHARGSAEVGAGFDSARLRLVCGDGRRGFPEEAPYDAIHVGAAAPSIPEELIGQLRPGGRLVCPVGAAGKSQQMYAIDRDPRDTFGSTSTPRYTKRAMFGVSYVPLTDANKQTCR